METAVNSPDGNGRHSPFGNGRQFSFFMLLLISISISCGNEEPTSYPPSVKIYGISAPGFVAVSEFFGNIGENQSFEICSFNFVV